MLDARTTAGGLDRGNGKRSAAAAATQNASVTSSRQRDAPTPPSPKARSNGRGVSTAAGASSREGSRDSLATGNESNTKKVSKLVVPDVFKGASQSANKPATVPAAPKQAEPAQGSPRRGPSATRDGNSDIGGGGEDTGMTGSAVKAGKSTAAAVAASSRDGSGAAASETGRAPGKSGVSRGPRRERGESSPKTSMKKASRESPGDGAKLGIPRDASSDDQASQISAAFSGHSVERAARSDRPDASGGHGRVPRGRSVRVDASAAPPSVDLASGDRAGGGVWAASPQKRKVGRSSSDR